MIEPSTVIEVTVVCAVAVFEVRDRTSSVPPFVTSPSRCASVAPSTSAVGSMIVTLTRPPPPPGIVAVALLSDVASTWIAAPEVASIEAEASTRASVEAPVPTVAVAFVPAPAKSPTETTVELAIASLLDVALTVTEVGIHGRAELGERAAVHGCGREADADREEAAGADVG